MIQRRTLLQSASAVCASGVLSVGGLAQGPENLPRTWKNAPLGP